MRLRYKILASATTLALLAAPVSEAFAAGGCDRQCTCNSLAAGAFRAVYNTTGSVWLAVGAAEIQYGACMAF